MLVVRIDMTSRSFGRLSKAFLSFFSGRPLRKPPPRSNELFPVEVR